MIQAVSAQSIGLLGIPESVESKRTFTNLSSNFVEIHNLLKYHNQIINLWSLSFRLRTFGYPTSSKYIQFYSMFFLRKARRISFGRRGKTHLSRQVDIQVQCHRTHTALCAWPCRIKWHLYYVLFSAITFLRITLENAMVYHWNGANSAGDRTPDC